MAEEQLKGGQSTDSVVKIGDTVHRTRGPHSEYVHELLTYLEKQGYQNAPKFLGIDADGREILTFQEGEVARDYVWTDESLLLTVRMMKAFHDATEGSALVGDKEVVCHRDLAPWNTVIRDGQPSGFIDFDGAEPGYRVEDLAYFLWTFLELGSDTCDDETQLSRIKLLCEGYGHVDPEHLIKALLSEQERVKSIRESMVENAKDESIRQYSKEKIKVIEQEIQWVKTNTTSITGTIRSEK